MISFVSLFFAALFFSLLYSVFTKQGAIQECSPELTMCNGVCVDTRSDNLNCNGCGNTCRTNSTCISSSCVCDEPTTLCGDVCISLSQDYFCCDEALTFVYQNKNHCGSCNPCPSEQECTGSGGYQCE
jgi:hypothetical protein